MNAIHASQLVSQIVSDHPSCARLFVENDIDFCCHGDVALTDACAERGLDPTEFLLRLRAVAAAGASDDTLDRTQLSTAELIAHIVSRHHAYLRRALPDIELLVAKVASVHDGHEPRLRELVDEVHELRLALEPHLDEEESDLFPLLMSRSADRPLVARLLAEAREEHEGVGRTLTRIRRLSDDFHPPSWACGSHRTMLDELAALEEDTLRHVHLENHVLMPRFAPTRRPNDARVAR